jgi:hypothetical protein
VSILNVVYRLDEPGTGNEGWSSYSFPYGVYVSGSTLDEVSSEFRDAIAAVPELEGAAVLEHTERPVPVLPGAYVRVAVDHHSLDREVAYRQIVSSLTVRPQRDEFIATAPLAATGDAVILACVSSDRLSWVFDQMDDHDGIGLCVAGPSTAGGSLLWWSFLIGLSSDRHDRTGDTETLQEAGLDGDSTVGDFMRATSSMTGHRLLVSAS